MLLTHFLLFSQTWLVHLNMQQWTTDEAWLKTLGLRFNPFAHLESSTDPYLLRYIVTPFSLRPVWDDVSALILAPVGGGKTTLRLYSAWNSLRGLFSYFPIPYVLPQEWWHLPSGNILNHGNALGRATARNTLLLLATFPHVFLEMPQKKQNELASLLAAMTDEYEWILALWSDETWESLMELLVEPSLINSFAKPRSQDIKKTLLVLEKPSSLYDKDPFKLICRVFDFLIEQFNYHSIHILLDGIDAFPETSSSATSGANWLQDWIDGFGTKFTSEYVRLKVFIPSEMEPIQGKNNLWQNISRKRAKVVWNRANLVELLRRRVFIASNRIHETINGLCSDDIDDLEEILIETIIQEGRPLPRELLALMQEIIRAHVLNDPDISFFTASNIESGIFAYRQKLTEDSKPIPALQS